MANKVRPKAEKRCLTEEFLVILPTLLYAMLPQILADICSSVDISQAGNGESSRNGIGELARE